MGRVTKIAVAVAIAFAFSMASKELFAQGFARAALSSPSLQSPVGIVDISWQTIWCVRGDGASCSEANKSDPERFRQVLVLSAGYSDAEYAKFRGDFTSLVDEASNGGGGTYSTIHRGRILYIGAWVPGKSLASGEANFGAKITANPIRGKALTLKTAGVVGAVKGLRAKEPKLAPLGVVVLFNTDDGDITETAIPSGYTETGYGIAKVTRGSLSGPYVPIHELAHAALNFQDEYVEKGFEEMSVSSLDALTPLALLDGSWGGWVAALGSITGVFSVRMSDILAANGNDNIDVTKYPSRVATSGYSANAYEYEGGLFFGRGTWHDSGNNIMNSNQVKRGASDGFAFAHSSAQKEIVKLAFETPGVARRPNDRIRNAGPLKPWGVSWGSTVRALMFDADKNHAFQPTASYDVQVSWEERDWDICYKWGIPYPCYSEVRRTVQKSVSPNRRYLDLKASKLKGLASLVQNTLCSAGLNQLGNGSSAIDLCSLSVDEMMDSSLPAIKFLMPYQEVGIPTDQKLTTYSWRFRTKNGEFTSGWTGWASFFKLF